MNILNLWLPTLCQAVSVYYSMNTAFSVAQTQVVTWTNYPQFVAMFRSAMHPRLLWLALISLMKYTWMDQSIANLDIFSGYITFFEAAVGQICGKTQVKWGFRKEIAGYEEFERTCCCWWLATTISTSCWMADNHRGISHKIGFCSMGLRYLPFSIHCEYRYMLHWVLMSWRVESLQPHTTPALLFRRRFLITYGGWKINL